MIKNNKKKFYSVGGKKSRSLRSFFFYDIIYLVNSKIFYIPSTKYNSTSTHTYADTRQSKKSFLMHKPLAGVPLKQEFECDLTVQVPECSEERFKYYGCS